MLFVPFRVALTTCFRGVSERSGVLVRGVDGRGDDAGGREAWGEYSPFADYSPERASRWWAAAMEAARGDWPDPVHDDVAVNAIVPVVPAGAVAAFATAHGCRTAKVKVGGPGTTAAEDEARVEAAAAALAVGGVDGRVRVDANGAWDVDEALANIRRLDLAARAGGLPGLEYVEQPCARVEDLAAVRRRSPVPIAADESVRIPGDVEDIVRLDAVDIVVLKANPLGGVRACLRLAERVGRPVVVSSAMESSVGLRAGVALACALPGQPYAHGLGTGALLGTDTVERTLVPQDGRLSRWTDMGRVIA